MKKILKWPFTLSPSMQILIGLVLGLVVGSIFGEQVAFLKMFGDIFLRMIKMTIVPLIFISVTYVFCSIGDISKMGRIAIKCMGIYVVTTLFTTLIGIYASVFLQAGSGIGGFAQTFTTAVDTASVAKDITISNMLVIMFPDNPFVSFVQGDILQVLVFAVFFGIAMNSLHNDVANVAHLFDAMSKIVFKLVNIVIKFTPIGIFGIMAYMAGTQDMNTIKSLALLVLIIYVGGFFVVYIFYGFLLLCVGLSPMPFFKKIFELQSFAFLTSSSAASVPLSKIVSEKKLGVSKNTASLTIPLGAAFNMNGSSLHAGAVVVFFANVAGIDLSMMHYFKILFLSVMLTLGCAGLPGGPLLRLPIIFASVGIPAEYITIYIAIDRFVDMLLAAINVTGDVIAGVLVDKSEGTFNKEMYYSKNSGRAIDHHDVQSVINSEKSA